MEIRVGDNILMPRGAVAPNHRESMAEVKHTAVPLTKHLHTCHWCGKPWDCAEVGCNLPDVVTKIRCPNRPGFPAEDNREGGVTAYATDGQLKAQQDAGRVIAKAKMEAYLDTFPSWLRDVAKEQRKTR